MNDKHFMEIALALAKKGEGYTSPNPMVGAVVVKGQTVVGQGFHKAAGEDHAEVVAIKDAGFSANGATLYVTLEPCNHTGRTSPCTERVLEAGISRMVAAMKDPNPDIVGGGIAYLKKKGISVSLGVCENEAKRLNEAFIKYVNTKRPFVTIKCASTLDGRIATRTGDARWVSGNASRKFVHRLRHQVDGIMVGVETIKRDNPHLTTRLDGKKGLDPTRIILDTHLSVPENANVLSPGSASDTLIVTGKTAPDPATAEKKVQIEKRGFRVIESPVKGGWIDLDRLMDRLGAMGLTSLLVEGGSRVIGSALSSGIGDKILFFYAPKILGGDDGFPICKGTGPASMSGCIPVKNISVHRFENDVMIEGYIDHFSDVFKGAV
jgi:diaminohydroxyphosphoribosylaminopyrimidine deaminase/5-amino-6-(5-phosphoribosylamino)uracil reductase